MDNIDDDYFTDRLHRAVEEEKRKSNNSGEKLSDYLGEEFSRQTTNNFKSIDESRRKAGSSFPLHSSEIKQPGYTTQEFDWKNYFSSQMKPIEDFSEPTLSPTLVNLDNTQMINSDFVDQSWTDILNVKKDRVKKFRQKDRAKKDEKITPASDTLSLSEPTFKMSGLTDIVPSFSLKNKKDESLSNTKPSSNAKSSSNAKYWLTFGALASSIVVTTTLVLTLYKRNHISRLDENRMAFYNIFVSEIQADTFLNNENKEALLRLIKERLTSAQNVEQLQSIYDSKADLIIHGKQSQLLSNVEEMLVQDLIMEQSRKEAILRESRQKIATISDDKSFREYISEANPIIKEVLDHIFSDAKNEVIRELETKVFAIGLKDHDLVSACIVEIEHAINKAQSYDELRSIETIQWNVIEGKILPTYKQEKIAEIEKLIKDSHYSDHVKAQMLSKSSNLINSAISLDDLNHKMVEVNNFLLQDKVNGIFQLAKRVFAVISTYSFLPADKEMLIRSIVSHLKEDDANNLLADLTRISALSSLSVSEKAQFVANISAVFDASNVNHAAVSAFEEKQLKAVDDFVAMAQTTHISIVEQNRNILNAIVHFALATSDDELNKEIQNANDDLISLTQKYEIESFIDLVDSTNLPTSEKSNLVVKVTFAIHAVRTVNEINATVQKCDEDLLNRVKKFEINVYQALVNMNENISSTTKTKLINTTSASLRNANSILMVTTIVARAGDALLSEVKKADIEKLSSAIVTSNLSQSVTSQWLAKWTPEINNAPDAKVANAKLSIALHELEALSLQVAKQAAIDKIHQDIELAHLDLVAKLQLKDKAETLISQKTSLAELESAIHEAQLDLLFEVKKSILNAFITNVKATALDTQSQLKIINEAKVVIDAANSAQEALLALKDINTKLLAQNLEAGRAIAIGTFISEVSKTTLLDAVKQQLIDDARRDIGAQTTIANVALTVAAMNDLLLSHLKHAAIEEYKISVDRSSLSVAAKTAVFTAGSIDINGATSPADIADKILLASNKLAQALLVAGKTTAI